MSILVRAEETGFIELPVRLTDAAGTPVDGITTFQLKNGGCIDFYFANGDEESIVFVTALGPPPYSLPTWRQVGGGPPLVPVGLYHIWVPRRIFRASRRGPFQYVVIPGSPVIET